MEQRENGRPASLARSLTLINDRNLLAHPCQSFEERRGELKWVKKTQSLHIFCCQSQAKSERERQKRSEAVSLCSPDGFDNPQTSFNHYLAVPPEVLSASSGTVLPRFKHF